ncbi:hypothetical protein AB0K43_09780 [Kitasatospora sp. NPDC049258]|uniref:hypothetical protein n=1 Tax=Kitasatospora sp. NPDC049258 TaxID=3155394 RepID=UPI0034434CB0
MTKPAKSPALKPVRKNPLDGLSSWQLLLTLVPLALLFIGGAIGGAIGAVALFTNATVAKKPFATPVKAALMVGVVVAAFVVYLAVAVAINSAVGS